MANLTRGSHDERVMNVKRALDEYERLHPGSTASVYRQKSAWIRVRIVDDRFDGWSQSNRHDDVWRVLSAHLTYDDLLEISMLLILTPAEQATSLLSSEFDDPIPSTL